MSRNFGWFTLVSLVLGCSGSPPPPPPAKPVKVISYPKELLDQQAPAPQPDPTAVAAVEPTEATALTPSAAPVSAAPVAAAAIPVPAPAPVLAPIDENSETPQKPAPVAIVPPSKAPEPTSVPAGGTDVASVLPQSFTDPNGQAPKAEVDTTGPGTFYSLAQQAIKARKDQEALEFLYAHYAVHGGSDFSDKLKWVDGLKRPVLALRVGLGIVYQIPVDFKDSPQPVGRPVAKAPGAATTKSDEKKPRRILGDAARTRREGKAGSATEVTEEGGTAKHTVPVDPEGTLDYFTGDLGQRVLDEIDNRQEDDRLGDILMELESRAGGPFRQATTTGLSASSTLAELKARAPQPVWPGVTLLGIGDERELKKRARDAGIDVLIVFDVEVRKKLASVVNNNTQIVIYNVAGDTPIVTGKAINNVKVTEEREKDKDADSVGVEIRRIFEALDATFRRRSLPAAITPQRALTRAQSLMEQIPESPTALTQLAEIRLYQSRRDFSEVDLVALLQEGLGEERAALWLAADGDESKLEVFRRWFTAEPVKLTRGKRRYPDKQQAGVAPGQVRPATSPAGPNPPAAEPPPLRKDQIGSD